MGADYIVLLQMQRQILQPYLAIQSLQLPGRQAHGETIEKRRLPGGQSTSNFSGTVAETILPMGKDDSAPLPCNMTFDMTTLFMVLS